MSNNTFADVTLPANHQAEIALLATCLTHPKQYEKIRDCLLPEDFHQETHALAWKAFQAIHADNLQISVITLGDRLKRWGKLETFSTSASQQATGEAALAVLLSGNHTNVRDIDTLVALLKNLSAKRKIFDVISRQVEPVLNGKPAPEIIREIQTELGEIELQATSTQSGILSTYEALDLAYQSMEARANGQNLPVSTGLIDLDHLLGGWHKGDYITVAGRPGAGKTSFLLTTATQAAKAGKRVGIFTLEMSPQDLMNRIISQESGIPGNIIRDALLSDDQWPVYAHTIEILESLKFHICKSPSLSIPDIRTFARKMTYLGLDLLVIDYIGLITPGYAESRVQEVSQITRALKLLAREVDVPILAAAQMNRSVENRKDKEPQLSDLRESGTIEQDSDIVIFLWQSQPGTNLVQLKVAKHRSGPVGSVEAFFNHATTQFANAQVHSMQLNSPVSGSSLREFAK